MTLTLSRRPISESLDVMLGTEFPMLDHGFIRIVDYMGVDQSIIDAARVSYSRGTVRAREDQALLHYLMRHRHTTPFEMCEIKFHVKLPIFVARQWIRHRMANVNEVSARYSVLDKEFYIPAPENMAAQSTTNRQGRGDVLEGNRLTDTTNLLRAASDAAYSTYELLLDEDGLGLARELARMSLTLNTYTQWYWKTDLHNLFNFLTLRADSHAQYEIRVYAEKMLEITQAWVPMAYNAFVEHRLQAYTLSASGMKFLAILMREGNGSSVPTALERVGMSKREYNEFVEALKTAEAAL